MSQLKSLMEREALEGSQQQPSASSPSKCRPEELFLYPAESSTLTMLPGVARVVHSKASCTVHWLESGKSRPNAKELPAAQILGIQTAAPPRGAARSGRGGPLPAPGDAPRPEALPPEPFQDGGPKVEEKRSSEAAARTAEPLGSGPAPADGCGALATPRSAELLLDGPPEPCRDEHNSSLSSPESGHTPPGKTALGGAEEAALATRPVEQIREEGWSGREADGVTLAELYLMFGKPGKLQLEYEWQPAAGAGAVGAAGGGAGGHDTGQPPPLKSGRAQRVLRCLLKLVTTEVNPKPLVRTPPARLPHFLSSSTICCSAVSKNVFFAWRTKRSLERVFAIGPQSPPSAGRQKNAVHF